MDPHWGALLGICYSVIYFVKFMIYPKIYVQYILQYIYIINQNLYIVQYMR